MEDFIDSIDGCTDSIERLYKKNVVEGLEVVVPTKPIDDVRDPVDKRIKGRIPSHQKGYRTEKTKNS